jgi:tripartite-type tricarboxylate transporter receptor subunit TctC
MEMKFRSLTAIALAAGAVVSAARAQDSVAQFYRGKTLTIMVTNGVGGGFDTYARHISRFLGAHIPGNPAVLVQNMPGAGGVVGTNWIATIGAKDGTILGAVHPAALMEPLLGDARKVKYDPAKFQYVGNANSDVFVCVMRADAPAKTFAEAFDKQLIVGAAGDAASLRDMPTLLNNVLGTKLKIVSGYDGSREIQIAIERGEIHGQCGVAWSAISAVHPDWFSSGLVRPFVQEAVVGYPTLDTLGVPRSVDFAKTSEQRGILELGYSIETIGRPYLMAAEVPRERVDAIRKAYAETFADPDFIAEARRIQLDVTPMTGEEVQRHVSKVYATPADIVAKTRKALRPEG